MFSLFVACRNGIGTRCRYLCMPFFFCGIATSVRMPCFWRASSRCRSGVVLCNTAVCSRILRWSLVIRLMSMQVVLYIVQKVFNAWKRESFFRVFLLLIDVSPRERLGPTIPTRVPPFASSCRTARSYHTHQGPSFRFQLPYCFLLDVVYQGNTCRTRW